jgi:hypothetical protein
MNNTPISIGNRVIDLSTGYTGTVMQKVELLGGTVQLSVQPDLDPANPRAYPDAMNIDAHTLEYIDEGIAARVTPAPDVATLEVQLGARVYDKVTGIEGIVTSRVTFLNGCVYFNVQPKSVVDKETGVTVLPDVHFVNHLRLGLFTTPLVDVKVPAASKVTGKVPGGPTNRSQRAG